MTAERRLRLLAAGAAPPPPKMRTARGPSPAAARLGAIRFAPLTTRAARFNNEKLCAHLHKLNGGKVRALQWAPVKGRTYQCIAGAT